jgi:hypothetical protein
VTHAEDAATPPAAEAIPPDAEDFSMSMEEAASLAVRVVPAALLLVGAHLLLHGWDSLYAGGAFILRLRFFLPALLGSIVVHEGLHAAGFLLFGRVGVRNVRFGIDRQTFSPFAGARVPMPVWAYRAAVVLPGIFLGVVPVVAGLAGGTGWLTLWGAFMLVTAGGDLAALRALRGVPGAARVVDHPTRVGGLVLREARAPSSTVSR